MKQANVAVVGGGIVGLANALAAARRGHSVVLFERDRQAVGASVRNFGMVWPIGQPPGPLHRTAMRSRAIWLEVAAAAGFWVNPCGSLHLLQHPDELAVAEEFVQLTRDQGYDCAILDPAETRRRSPVVRAERILGALWSSTELCVDPRQVIARLPHFLQEQYGVSLRFGSLVTEIDHGLLRTSAGEVWEIERAIVCSGADFQTLFPEVFVDSGIRKCKLHMMRTAAQPDGLRLGPHLATGLTLGHYTSFQICPSLPALKARFAREMPEYLGYGIHVMASQNQLGEVVIGDSHEYEDPISPFDDTQIDRLILAYLEQYIELPAPQIATRWQGVYAKHPTRPIFIAEARERVQVMVAPGGAGMTMSFGIADEFWANQAVGRPQAV
jgi:FAD dependent oxidoreductase TIGR03364